MAWAVVYTSPLSSFSIAQGQAFISKPPEAVFRDFEVGRVYRQRLQLTNVSYTVNHCKLLGPSEAMEDFVTVEFNPPGSLSAGLTCSLLVTFQPKVCVGMCFRVYVPLSTPSSFLLTISPPLLS